MAATSDAKRRGHSRVGTEDLLYALFNNTKADSRARYWLGKQAQTRSVELYPDDTLVESNEESSTRMLVRHDSFNFFWGGVEVTRGHCWNVSTPSPFHTGGTKHPTSALSRSRSTLWNAYADVRHNGDA